MTYPQTKMEQQTVSEFLNVKSDSGTVDIRNNTIGSKITNVTLNVASSSSRDEDTPNLESELSVLNDKLREAYKKITLPQVSWMDNGSLLLDSHCVTLTLDVDKSSISLEELFDGDVFPKRILVGGPPGYGKTTLSHKIVNDWALNHEYTQRFKLVFLVKLRDLDQTIEKELADIAESFGYETKRIMDKIISKFADKTLLVLDGLDELAQQNKLDVLKVLFRSQFSNATVITTCRMGSYKLMEVEKKLLFKGTTRSSDYYDKKIMIKGLNYYNRETLLKNLITSTDKEAITKRIEQIIRPVQSLFECPLFMILLVFVVEDNPNVEIETKTDLFKNLFDCIIRRSCTKLDRDLPDDFTIFGTDKLCLEFREVFYEFGKYSTDNLKKKSLQFECNYITDKIYEMGFLIRGETKYKFKTHYHYEGFHLTLLEFAAAYSMWVDYKINGRFFDQEEIKDMVNIFARSTTEFSLVFPFFGGLLGDEMTTFYQCFSHYAAIFSTARRSVFDILAECSSSVKLSSAIVPFLPQDIVCDSIFENTHVWKALVCLTKVKFKNIRFSEIEVLPQKTQMEHLVFLVDESKDFVCQDISVVSNLRCNIFELSLDYHLGGSSSKEIEEWLKIFKSVSAQTKKLDIDVEFNSIVNDLVAKNLLNPVPIDSLFCSLRNQPSDEFFITHIVANNQLHHLEVDIVDGRASSAKIMSAVSISSYLETVELVGCRVTFIDISVLTNNGEKKWKRVKLTAMTVNCTTPLVNSKCITEFQNTSCTNSTDVFSRVIPEVLHCDYEYITDAYRETLFEAGWHILKELILSVTAYRECDELVPCLSKLYSVNSSLMVKLHVVLWLYDKDYEFERDVVQCLRSVNINTILCDFHVSGSEVKFSQFLDVIVREKIKIQTLGLINWPQSDFLRSFIPAIVGCLDIGNVNVVMLSGCKRDMFGIITHSSLDYSKYNIQHMETMKEFGKNLSIYSFVKDCVCISLK